MQLLQRMPGDVVARLINTNIESMIRASRMMKMVPVHTDSRELGVPRRDRPLLMKSQAQPASGHQGGDRPARCRSVSGAEEPPHARDDHGPCGPGVALESIAVCCSDPIPHADSRTA